MTDHLTPTRSNHVVRQLHTAFVETRTRLRQLAASYRTLQPAKADYPGGAWEGNLALWQEHEAALKALEGFLDGGLAYVDNGPTEEQAATKAANEPTAPGVETEDPALIERFRAKTAAALEDIRNGTDTIAPPAPRPEGDE